jgi:uncharacterized HAD superfamily protein
MINTIRIGLDKIPSGIDCVVGLPRSGMMPAMYIGLVLNIEVTDFQSFREKRVIERGETTQRPTVRKFETKKVLVVDDSCHTGTSISKAKKTLREEFPAVEFIFASVYCSNPFNDAVDFFWEQLDPPHVFEWNFNRNIVLNDTIFDIDGVLCKNPTRKQEEKEDEYLKFLETADPLIIPNRRIAGIVTGRLIKYRQITEKWLEKHGIDYGFLEMDTGLERSLVSLRDVACRKGAIFNKSNASLFIESSPEEARIIKSMSKKKVLCFENGFIFDETDQPSGIGGINRMVFWKAKYILEKNKDKSLCWDLVYKLARAVVKVVRNFKI